MQDAVDDATAIASGAGGFVVSSQVDDEDGGRASLVVRVPADRFEQTLVDLGGLGEVATEAVSGEDVSQEFIDLEARLRNASAQEAVLLRLMDESQTIADTIRVQRELQQVQLEIERLRGRIRYLEDRTAFGTISIGFLEGGAPPPSDPSTLARAWDLARDRRKHRRRRGSRSGGDRARWAADGAGPRAGNGRLPARATARRDAVQVAVGGISTPVG